MIGIVIPSYNEHDGLVALCESVKATVKQSHMIVVVDDSPNLKTVDTLKDFKHPKLIVIHRKTKGGRGSAVIEGIEKCVNLGCTQIVEMDADFSHPTEELSLLMTEASQQRLGLLIGSRYLPQSQIINWPLSRRIFSRCANWLARRILGVPIHDYTNGYRCYSRAAAIHIVKTCGKLGKGFIALSEILVNLYFSGFTVSERPTVFRNRVRGESSVNLTEISGALVGLMRIYGLKRKLQAQNEQLARSNS
ncbi:MAG: glycosyltransferase [Bdellovibrionales bacterium]|nr:glycosyltransferase [Bdellovibrionales bacterium]